MRATRIPHTDLARFRAVLAERFGLELDAHRADHLGEVLAARLDAVGARDARTYLDRLASLGQDELDALAPLVTVGETFFLRNPDNFRALAELILPERIAARDHARTLRILSAGCSTGEEPYSIAMCVRDALPDVDAWDVRIVAIDVNHEALSRAADARYSAWSLRATPDELRARWFLREGASFALHPALRRMVTFRRANLATDDDLARGDGVYDVVFCRNVLMYLAPDVAAAAVRRLRAALAPGGFFFLGHAETMRGLSDGFDLCATHGTFYYRRNDGPRARPGPLGAPTPAKPDPLGDAAGATGPRGDSTWAAGDATWATVIDRASKHIAALADRPTPADARAPLGSAGPADADLGAVMEALREERFGDALAHLDALPDRARARPDARLVRAVLLTNATRLDEAAEVCRSLLSDDDACTGAHYLLALHAAHAGDHAASIAHARRAVELDPTFAMARLQWGIVARRRGERADARRILRDASDLLAREDASRVALFGGGFSREALLRVCADELRAAGGPR